MITPVTYLAVVFVVVLLVAGAGTYYFTQMSGGGMQIPDLGGTESETEQQEEEDEAPLSGSASSMDVTPSERQQSGGGSAGAGGGVQLEVQETREDNALGTVITVEVKQGSISVGDTVSFIDAEGRVGTLEKDGKSIDEAQEGDVVSFSLIGVDNVSIEEGMVGEKQ